MITATAIVVLVILVLVLLAVARWGWRLLRENEEPTAGGSMSEQMVGRRHKEPKREP